MRQVCSKISFCRILRHTLCRRLKVCGRSAAGLRQVCGRSAAYFSLSYGEEPIAVYAAAITTLVEEAFPSYGSSAKEGEKFRRFVVGLSPFLQVRVHELGAKAFQEAVDIAIRVERAHVMGQSTQNLASHTTVATVQESDVLERIDRSFFVWKIWRRRLRPSICILLPLALVHLPQTSDTMDGETLLLDIAHLPQNVDKTHGNTLLLDIVHLPRNVDEIHGNILLHLAIIHHIVLSLVHQVQITGTICRNIMLTVTAGDRQAHTARRSHYPPGVDNSRFDSPSFSSSHDPRRVHFSQDQENRY